MICGRAGARICFSSVFPTFETLPAYLGRDAFIDKTQMRDRLTQARASIIDPKMEATLELQTRGPVWMPITPLRGSLFHADSQLSCSRLEIIVELPSQPDDVLAVPGPLINRPSTQTVYGMRMPPP